MSNLPPTGDLPTFQKVTLLFVTVFTWAVGVLLAWKISKPTDPCIGEVIKIPLVSGAVGLITIFTSIFLAPIAIPNGEVGRWDENFNEKYTTMSILVYYVPFRTLIPTGFSIVCFGVLISVANILQREKLSINRFMKTTLALITLAATLGTVGCLIFARHIDRKLHIQFFYIMFAGWAILPSIGSLAMRSHHFFVPLVFCSYIVVMLAIVYIFAHNGLVKSKGILCLIEQALYSTQLIWLLLFGRTIHLDLDQILKEFEEEESILTLDDCPIEKSDIDTQRPRYSQIRTSVIVFTLLFILNAAAIQNVTFPEGLSESKVEPNTVYKSPIKQNRTRSKHHSGKLLLGSF